MTILHELPKAALLRRAVFALAALSLLAGCNTTGAGGDFGEVPRVFARDDIHDWVGRSAVEPGKPSDFNLTDDERRLRDLAFPLIEPPYDRQQWYSTLQEYGYIDGNVRMVRNPSDYARRLLTERYRSPAGQYAQVTDDIRNDTTRLPQFFETATRVHDIDQKRSRSLAYIPNLHPKERDNALRRIRENAAIVEAVRASLAQRVAGYRYALERLVVMTPSAQAVDVERTLNQLQSQIAYYRTHPAPTWAREQSLASAR